MTVIDRLDWPVKLILTIFLGPVVMGINRVLRGKYIAGIVWFLTGGLFGIGWFIDIVTLLTRRDIVFLA